MMWIKYSSAWLAQLPDGAKVIHLEQLLGSTDILPTLETMYSLRSVSVVGLTLLFVWIVGNISDQAILRVLSTGFEFSSSNTSFYYFDTSVDRGLSTYSPPAQVVTYGGIASTVFQAGVLSASVGLNYPSDIWGNVKIPILQDLNASLADANGWIPVPTSNVSFTSLIGTPIAGISPEGNSRFPITTSYFYATCGNPVLYSNKNDEVTWPEQNVSTCGINTPPTLLGGNRKSSNGTILGTCSLGSLMDNTWNESESSSSQLRLVLFQNQAFSGISAFNCSIEYITAESVVECAGLNCSVTSIRAATSSTPSWISPLENCTTAQNFYDQFAAACQPFQTSYLNAPVSSPLEVYLMYNGVYNGAGTDYIPQLSVDLASLSAADLSDRFTRVLNSFWTASFAPSYVPGAMSSFNLSSLAGNPSLTRAYPGIQGSTPVVKSTLIYVCNYAWLVLLLFASGGFALMAVGATILKFRVAVPDVFAYTSSVLRAPPHLESRDLPNPALPNSIKNCVVRLKDVEPGEQIGRLALMEMKDGPDHLAKKRTYAT
jgi:hypothetical protein